MSHGMTHEDARDTLEGLSLDALDATERDAVLAHVASCETCREHLTGLRDAAAALSYAVRPLPMSPAQRDRVRARLIERVQASRTPTISHTERPAAGAVSAVTPIGSASGRSRRWTHVSNFAAMAASLIAIVSLGLLVRTRDERDRLRAAVAESAVTRGLATTALDSARGSLADRDRLIANLTGADVAVMTLASTGERAPSGRMFWDRSVNAWTFVAHHLPASKPGRTYQLWLVTAGDKISAGTFTPEADGHAVVRATYALDRNALAAVAVTDEPSAGSAQPTTVPIIVGKSATD